MLGFDAEGKYFFTVVLCTICIKAFRAMELFAERKAQRAPNTAKKYYETYRTQRAIFQLAMRGYGKSLSAIQTG
jgi:hypothetical protein